ncbi:MAG: long-chain fatty acid--CoA ligase, partial [Desulfobacterales bacterium]
MTPEPNNTIYSIFAKAAERHPDKTAVIYLGTRFSYRKLQNLSQRFAAALDAKGVNAGQQVMMYIPNSIQWVVSWLGIQKLGAVAVPITPIYTPHDIRYIANDSEADAIICADTNFGYVTSVLPETGIKTVMVSKMADLLPWWKRFFGFLFDIIPRGKIALDQNTFAFRDLLTRHKDTSVLVQNGHRNGDAIAEILYTGGTTKFPKGVPITHNLFLVSALEQITMSSPLFAPEENVVMGNAPLFHILGQTCSLATLLTGGSIILQPRINMDASFDAIQRFKAKTMIGVPAMYRMILEHDRLHQYDLSSLEYCFSGGDVLPVEIGKRWKEKFGRPIYQGYGATETCGGVAMCPVDQENPPKSVGRVVPSKKVKIVDPAKLEPVATGEPGELLVSSTYMVSGYLKKPEETAESFVELDGEKWYRTADIMSM